MKVKTDVKAGTAGGNAPEPPRCVYGYAGGSYVVLNPDRPDDD